MQYGDRVNVLVDLHSVLEGIYHNEYEQQILSIIIHAY